MRSQRRWGIAVVLVLLLAAISADAKDTEAIEQKAFDLLMAAKLQNGKTVKAAFVDWLYEKDFEPQGWQASVGRAHKTYGSGISVALNYRDRSGKMLYADWLLNEKGEIHALTDAAAALGRVVGYDKNAVAAIAKMR